MASRKQEGYAARRQREILEATPPTDERVKELTDKGQDFYNAREQARTESYGPLPVGYSSWGDYFKGM